MSDLKDRTDELTPEQWVEWAAEEIQSIRTRLVSVGDERDRFNDALTKIRTENLSRFDCILIAAEAQGFFK